MAVDIKLNDMIDDLAGRLHNVPLEDVELSIRTFKALKDCGANTLGEAQQVILDRKLHKRYGIGPKAVREAEEIIHNVSETLVANRDLYRKPIRIVNSSDVWGKAKAMWDRHNVTAEQRLFNALFGEGDATAAAVGVLENYRADIVAEICEWLRGDEADENIHSTIECAEQIEARFGKRAAE